MMEEKDDNRLTRLHFLLRNEEEYVQTLVQYNDNIVRKLLRLEDILPPRVIMFLSLLPQLQVLHAQIFAELEKRVSEDGEHAAIGDIFYSYARLFEVYSRYVNHYKECNAFISEALDNGELARRKGFFMSRQMRFNFRTFIKAEAVRGAKGFLNLLVLPIQRIPRYILWLQDILNKTDPEINDFKWLQWAVRRIRAVNQTIEKKLRR